jgi:hypothetical protein
MRRASARRSPRRPSTTWRRPTRCCCVVPAPVLYKNIRPVIRRCLLCIVGHDIHRVHSATALHGETCRALTHVACHQFRCYQMRRSGKGGTRAKILKPTVKAAVTTHSGTCSRAARSSTSSGSTSTSTNAVCSNHHIVETGNWAPHACLYFRGSAITSAELQKLNVECNDQMTLWRTNKPSVYEQGSVPSPLCIAPKTPILTRPSISVGSAVRSR